MDDGFVGRPVRGSVKSQMAGEAGEAGEETGEAGEAAKAAKTGEAREAGEEVKSIKRFNDWSRITMRGMEMNQSAPFVLVLCFGPPKRSQFGCLCRWCRSLG